MVYGHRRSLVGQFGCAYVMYTLGPESQKLCAWQPNELNIFGTLCRSISYFSSLLDKDDRPIRIAAGEALALIFEIGSLEKFAGEAKGPTDGSVQEGNKSREGFTHIQGQKAKILNQVRDLSAEAGGKGSTKKDLNSQRNLFKDVLEFLEVLIPLLI